MSVTHGTFIFNPDPRSYDGAFYRQRKAIADKDGKPEFLKIHPHTFRHVRGTFDRINGVPIEEVKYKLGHKSLQNLEKYDHWSKVLYGSIEERFYSTTTATDEEADKLIGNGWQFVCANPVTGRMHFKKPKRIGE
jgi:hypothetical protein